MAVVKNKTTNIASKLRLVIVVCILILVAVPLTIGLLGYKNKAGLTSYQGNSYTFYYPKGWTRSQSEMSDINGTEFFLQPPAAAPPKTPHVIIEVAPATLTAVSDITDPFTIFKYAKTNTVVNGVTAQKFTTIVPSSEGVLHSIAYIFEANGKIYLIALGYKQEATDTELENEFLQIVTDFTPR